MDMSEKADLELMAQIQMRLTFARDDLEEAESELTDLRRERDAWQRIGEYMAGSLRLILAEVELGPITRELAELHVAEFARLREEYEVDDLLDIDVDQVAPSPG